jgi:hypothetical protein
MKHHEMAAVYGIRGHTVLVLLYRPLLAIYLHLGDTAAVDCIKRCLYRLKETLIERFRSSVCVRKTEIN